MPQNVIALREPVMIEEGLNYSAIVGLHECQCLFGLVKPTTDPNAVVDFLVLLVTKLLSSEWEQVPHGKEGYFFIENGSVQLREGSLTAARAMTGKVFPRGAQLQ